MIQVVFYEKKKFINKRKYFRDKDINKMIEYVRDGLALDQNSIIEISKWDNKTRERK